MDDSLKANESVSIYLQSLDGGSQCIFDLWQIVP